MEFTATPGVMSVRKELPVAPETLVGIHTVFGDGKRVSAFCLYGLGDPRSQFFLMTSWMGGIPPYPPSDVILRHVTCVDSYYI